MRACGLRSSASELTGDLLPNLNRRTVPVLGAFAAICVKKGLHDVAAVDLSQVRALSGRWMALRDPRTYRQEGLPPEARDSRRACHLPLDDGRIHCSVNYTILPCMCNLLFYIVRRAMAAACHCLEATVAFT